VSKDPEAGYVLWSLLWPLLVGCWLTAGLLAYYHTWRRLFVLERSGELQRWEGRVAGPDRDPPLRRERTVCGPLITVGDFTLRGPDGELRVDPRRAVLTPGPVPWRLRGFRRGQRVTVDGTLVYRTRQESLYREPGQERVIVADRIIHGDWARLRWLPALIPVIAVACGIWALTSVYPGNPRFTTAATVNCPAGAALASLPAFPSGWIHWCQTPEGLRHGPWVLWYADGTRRREVWYRHDELDGPWIEWAPARHPGEASRLRVRGQYRRGLRSGRWTRWDERSGRPLQSWRYHGGVREGCGALLSHRPAR
jgi:hypothetical protein